MTAPNRYGYWWAKGIGDNADLSWQLFAVDSIAGTAQLVARPLDEKLVVRLSGALHTRHPWFEPSADRWTNWIYVEKPK